MNKLERNLGTECRNLLAEFYSRLATMAFERHQWDLAADYLRMANEVYR